MMSNLDKNYEHAPYVAKPMPFLDVFDIKKTNKRKIKISLPLTNSLDNQDDKTQLGEPIAESTVCQQTANIDTIYVCTIAFQTKHPMRKFALNFTDRVKMKSVRGEYWLVENIVTHECGYVPKACLTSLHQFIDDMKYLNA